MSVHQESLDHMTKGGADMREQSDAPELEYRTARTDSLSMFASAIGGAILGMLLTLLILAIINGGTLSFTGGERLSVFEANLGRINENVGSVSANIDIVAEQARVMQAQLDEFENTLNGEVSEMGDAITELNQTKAQFDTFVGALTDALSSMDGAGE
ncbi:MAG: hypothetical protein H6642_11825 [Caldilineaceae bacterium]|nr:hypothetical protein [Caldilineaceae bacterium]MCB9139026.1 hypothetical protein [Caldilineaceae bacterium]